MRIRLTRKLANALNGLDLRQLSVGEVVEMSDPLARMLIAEQWAEGVVPADIASTADERPRRQKRANKPKSETRAGGRPKKR